MSIRRAEIHARTRCIEFILAAARAPLPRLPDPVSSGEKAIIIPACRLPRRRRILWGDLRVPA